MAGYSTAPPFTVHGVASDAVDVGFTLLGCLVRWLSAMRRVRRVGSFTLAVGDHFDEADGWPSVAYRTATLHGWWPRTGLTFSDDDMGGLTLTWSAPPSHDIRLPTQGFDFAGVRITIGVVLRDGASRPRSR